MDQATIDAKRAARAALNAQRAQEQQDKLNAMLAPYLAQQPSQDVLDEVQFRHDAYYGHTYAIVSPDMNDLREAAAALMTGCPTVPVKMQFGMSTVCSADHDQYSKKVGRAISAAKLQEVEVNVTGCHANDSAAYFSCTYEANGVHLSLGFMLTHGKIRPFLSSIHNFSDRISYSEKIRRK